ncbi:TRAP transporter substrate-binding protein [Chitinasiproducens palmae]|uniref:Tripartite ATP-independent transporter solute receptor, DctP family n=1 Tax=Chitinasiproducens palmae TaxID=1770053 RepID=A0A1H2PL40_9BURK|nr:TRAP transporter substrate-binding protein [Chitinasiproducens palmae]SDV47114.1 tripartite ATP-independent transporter solute receptor, DctP family [Chitinasiproducens palmae]
MSITRRRFLEGGAALAASSLATSRAFAADGTFNYKIGTNVPLSHPIYIRLQEAAESIRSKTGGKVNFKVFPNGQLGSDTEMLSQLRSGGIDFLTLPGVVLANMVPMASLNSVGFAFPDYPSVWKAMDGKLGAYIRGHISKAGLFVNDKVWDNGFRQITSYAPVNSAADLRNVKLRVPVSPLLLSLFKSLGAAPTPINFNELYSALQTRVVDGQENPLPIVASGKLYEVQKHCALTGHVWDGYWMLANRRSVDALNPAQRASVLDLLNQAAMAQRADSEKLAESLKSELSGKGLAFNTPSHDSFRSALSKTGFYKTWQDKFGAEAWAQLEAYTGKLA